MRSLALVLSLSSVLGVPGLLRACPSCQEAVPAVSDDEGDPARLARGYNHSIYLMAGMPYFLLGTVGFLVYRRLRLAGTAPAGDGVAQALPPGSPVDSTSPGDRACSLPSRGDVS
jgi:hypothetical protein